MHFRANGMGEVVPDFFAPAKTLGRPPPPPAALPAKTLGRAPGPQASTALTAMIAPPRVSAPTTSAATMTPPKTIAQPLPQSARPSAPSQNPSYVPPFAPTPSATTPLASSVVGGAGVAPIAPSGGGSYSAPSNDVAPPSASPSSNTQQAAPPPDLQKTPVSASIDVPWEMWAGLGLLASATIIGVVYVVTRHHGGPKK